MDCSVGEDEDVARTEVGSFPAAREPEEECCACAVMMRDPTFAESPWGPP